MRQFSIPVVSLKLRDYASFAICRTPQMGRVVMNLHNYITIIPHISLDMIAQHPLASGKAASTVRHKSGNIRKPRRSESKLESL